MKKSEKIFFVEDLTVQIRDAKSLFFVDITGFKVSQQEKLRRLLRGVGGRFIVAKNTLLARAVGKGVNNREQAESIKSEISGPTAIVIAEQDEFDSLRALGRFISEFEIPQLKFGLIGSRFEYAPTLLELSRLPAKEVIQANLVRSLAGPLYALLETLQVKLNQLVYLLNVRSQMLNAK